MTRRRRKPSALRYPLRIVAGVAVLYALGLVWFATTLPEAPLSAPKADAIVALTGLGDRLSPAVALLEEGDGERLLITGVYPQTTKRDLKPLLHGGAHFDCCADLGFKALDTRGNASEAAEWTRAHRYRSLIVVTASYHMPRSLLEFGAAMPDVQLIAFPVPAEDANFWQNAKRLNGEYAKYLASLTWLSLAGQASAV